MSAKKLYARDVPYDYLHAALEVEVAAGNARKNDNGSGLVSYCYTEQCTFARAWNATTMAARGLVLDVVRKEVVATPFPKFFNHGEPNVTIPDLPFEVFDKLDGSLIICFSHQGEWKCATKGSFNSEQAKWSRDWLHQGVLDRLIPGHTYLFEAIYPENRIVVRYSEKETGLHLLAIYNKDGFECPYDYVDEISNTIPCHVVKRFHYTHISELLAEATTLHHNREGFVIRFEDGTRLKIKGDEYKRIHKLVSNVTPLAIWEMMLNKDDLERIKKDLPDEFVSDFDQIVYLLGSKLSEIDREVVLTCEKVKDLTDKQLGLILGTFHPNLRSYLFPYRRRKAGTMFNDKTRASIFRDIRPTRNVLEGYTPSSSMNRVQSEQA